MSWPRSEKPQHLHVTVDPADCKVAEPWGLRRRELAAHTDTSLQQLPKDGDNDRPDLG
jgi:hypothetical protein